MYRQRIDSLKSVLLLLSVMRLASLHAQEVPAPVGNVPYLVTFGRDAELSWGDDDFSQVVFFTIPKSYTGEIFVRIFDPGTEGQHDEGSGKFNTKTRFALYGGTGAYSEKDARGTDPKGKYNSGTLLGSKVYDEEPKLDNSWVTLASFQSSQGERVDELDASVVKVIIDGMSGNDGNIYKLFLSTSGTENTAVPGANAFTYESSIRLTVMEHAIAHVYPYIPAGMSKLDVNVFDFDNDGQLKLFSEYKNGHLVGYSNDNEWSVSTHMVNDKEQNRCMDLQITKKGLLVNDMVFNVTGTDRVPVPLYNAPPGGVPRFRYTITVTRTSRKSR